MLKDRELAASLVDRLNQLLVSAPEVPDLLEELCERTVPVPSSLVNHPTIQVRDLDGEPSVGLLGILNGLLGVVPEGPRAGWGHIVAHFDPQSGKLLHFSLTEID